MQVPIRSSRKPTPADAEALAARAFSYLAAEPERIGPFLAESGLGPDNVRNVAGTPGFLPAVLDHLIANQDLLVAFADEHELDPATVVAARHALTVPPRET
jgi:hypothetical protein